MELLKGLLHGAKNIVKRSSKLTALNALLVIDILDQKHTFLKKNAKAKFFNYDFVKQYENMKCAICSYHTHDAEKNISEFMEKFQFSVKHTKGYMLFVQENEAADDVELRRGVLRAVKLNEKGVL